MTGTDGTTTFPPQDQPLDDAVPDVVAALDAEYFVEWQVADIAPLSRLRPS